MIVWRPCSISWESAPTARALRTVALLCDGNMTPKSEVEVSFLSPAGHDPRVSTLALCALASLMARPPADFADLLVFFLPYDRPAPHPRA